MPTPTLAPSQQPLTLEFSRTRGFFDDAFQLEIALSDPGAELFVSTEWGSEWKTEDFLAVATPYAGPILITESTQVRAVAVRTGNPSPVESHTFISYATALGDPQLDTVDTRAALNRFPIFELSSAPLANPDADAPAVAEVFWPDGRTEGIAAPVGVRHRGYNGQGSYFRLFFRPEYGDAALDYQLFPAAQGAQTSDKYFRINLHGGSRDSFGFPQTSAALGCPAAQGTLLQDRFYQDLQRRTSGDGLEGQYFLLFDQGRFVGVKNVEAASGRDYMAATFGATDAEYFVALDSGIEGPADVYSAMATAEQTWAHRDVPNFIDYHLIQWLSGHTNWPTSNFVSAGLQTGPFYNLVSDNQLSSPSCFGNFLRTVGFWPEADADFRLAVADRVLLHFFGDGALTAANLGAAWDELAAQVQPAMALPLTNGYTLAEYPETEWQAAQSQLRTDLVNKQPTLLAQLAAYGYYPSVEPVVQSLGIGTDRFVTLTHPNGVGQVYFTTDGSDPRSPGGAVSPTAQLYSEAILLPAGDVELTARVLQGSIWSAAVPKFYRSEVRDGGITVSYGTGSMVTVANNGAVPVDLEYFRIQGDVRYKFDYGRAPVLGPGEVLNLNSSQFIGVLDRDVPLQIVDPYLAVVDSDR